MASVRSNTKWSRRTGIVTHINRLCNSKSDILKGMANIRFGVCSVTEIIKIILDTRVVLDILHDDSRAGNNAHDKERVTCSKIKRERIACRKVTTANALTLTWCILTRRQVSLNRNTVDCLRYDEKWKTAVERCVVLSMSTYRSSKSRLAILFPSTLSSANSSG